MAAEVNCGASFEVPPWLKSMPVAPEYHPTLAEFQDPIGYIFKIEKEAAKYGICKIVPPVPAGSKKTVIANFNRSLLARAKELNPGSTFTTRQQQIGFCPRKHRPVKKSVWLSGEKYTLSEFEAKAKSFEKSYLKKYAKKELNALETETLFWNATVDKPFSVEYANDMPGSAFVTRRSNVKKSEGVVTVGESDWNMRGVSRVSVSLLRFMKEEIPGVTSPMVYVAMMFSWFAWHVEDHDFHSLNYLHMGAGKTWYGVPHEAAFAFEEVIREHGYGGEINPLVTFATLGEKTTVMSPEVLLNAGVPCCRLVQNAGEFVVTFPRAYHSGFSHGFNCGEAANIATPEWLRVAKDAAIRRASINCPPMVSHFQLLYDLALSLCSRVPKSIAMKPRSSRLKEKNKDEGEILIKELFCRDMMQNNNILHILGKGSSIVLLPQNSLNLITSPNSQDGFHFTTKFRFPGLCSPNVESKTSSCNVHDDFTLDRMQVKERFCDVKETPFSLGNSNDMRYTERPDSDVKKASQYEQGLFTCVTCGILCFTCVAIVQPTKATAQYLKSADCSIFNDWGIACSDHNPISDAANPQMNSCSGMVQKYGLLDIPPYTGNRVRALDDESLEMDSNNEASNKGPSSLGLLALAYGNSSDSEENEDEEEFLAKARGTGESSYLDSGHACENTDSNISCGKEVYLHNSDSYTNFGLARETCNETNHRSSDSEVQTSDCAVMDSNSLTDRFRHQRILDVLNGKPVAHESKATMSTGFVSIETSLSLYPRSDEDSSRFHVFCLHHAMEVEKQLNSIGGAHVFLVCHPDYPRLESQAKKVAEELENDYLWNEIPFREASEEDKERIQLALDSENAIHGNGDWAVKMGINLFYSANLCRSPLYCKQMPYNSVLYSAFGRRSPVNGPSSNSEFEGKGSGRQRKIVVAGKWCGKVWMSSQAHPLLVDQNLEEMEQEKGITALVDWPDLRSEKLSDCYQAAETTSKTSKSRGKRKSTDENSSHLKAMTLEVENVDEPPQDHALSKSRKQVKNKCGTKLLKKETTEAKNLDESAEEFPLSNCWTQIRSKSRTKRVEKESSEDEKFDESFENIPIGNFCKQIKSERGIKRLKEERNNSKNLDESPQEIPPSIYCKLTKSNFGTRLMVTREHKKNHENSGKWSNLLIEDEDDGGPSTRLRKRAAKTRKDIEPRSSKLKIAVKKLRKDTNTKKRPTMKSSATSPNKVARARDEENEHLCDVEGCTMSFGSKHELTMHKRNICPVKGCGKKFFSHKYLVQHRRVHLDDRPLKCPWKGCKMSFKWAWARTEHIRVHTGARPYICNESGCGQTFRFVSDFSRHKRKTGHNPKKARG
ncbi:lysine-specific demethylase REF6-like [Primulina huaijiensis]|uniref:lysine-specific demethylase REF6-like n=1 Tax=Primulina huaijiensis TaxID=1492673 RepID=UPI003CC796E2